MNFVFLIYRLIFAMIPLIFENKIGIQIILLISITVIYIGLILNFRCSINPFNMYLDITCLVIFLMMQHHLLLFMDGGILNGTPNVIAIDEMINF